MQRKATLQSPDVLTHAGMSYGRERGDTTASVCVSEPLSCLLQGPPPQTAQLMTGRRRSAGTEGSSQHGWERKKGGKDERVKGATTFTPPTDPLWIDGHNSECVLLKRRA